MTHSYRPQSTYMWHLRGHQTTTLDQEKVPSSHQCKVETCICNVCRKFKAQFTKIDKLKACFVQSQEISKLEIVDAASFGKLV